MKNLKGDLIWTTSLVIWVIILVMPSSRSIFIHITEKYPYWGGFVKFFILASMGDMLGSRIQKKEWIIPKNFIKKAIVWGILGMMITLVFTVFMAGVLGAQKTGRLPFYGSKFAQAFLGSSIMNLTFGPMLYIYHKFMDLWIDIKFEEKTNVTIKAIVDKIDWYTLVSFSWLKTCIFIWIPLHTIVFLMPSEYRVLSSAFLSILLGVLIAITKKKKVS